MKLKEIKQLNESKFLTNNDQILEWLEDHCEYRSNWTIDPDGKVNNESADGITVKTPTIPVKFGKIGGKFFVVSKPQNIITHLDWLPDEIDGDFEIPDALASNITSMIGGPRSVNGEYSISGNDSIRSLDGIPKDIKSLDIWGCRIESLVGIEHRFPHLEYLHIHGDNPTFGRPIKEGGLGLITLNSFKRLRTFGDVQEWITIINKYAGKPDDIFECQAELIDKGFEAHAEL